MTLELTKTLTTRDGRPVRLFAQDVISDFPIIGAIKNPDGSEDVRCWSKTGGLIHGHETQTDLINPPERVKGWLNVYGPSGNSGLEAFSYLRTTKEEADRMATPGRVACIFVDFPRGTGL